MEWEHPARTSIDPMAAIAKMTSLKIEGKYVMGEAVLLDNPKANQLKTLIDNGVKISVSSRGVGAVKNGVVENYRLITYDAVAAPSDYNATMNGLVESYQLNEGVVEGLVFNIDGFGNIVPMNESNTNADSFEKKDLDEALEKEELEDEELKDSTEYMLKFMKGRKKSGGMSFVDRIEDRQGPRVRRGLSGWFTSLRLLRFNAGRSARSCTARRGSSSPARSRTRGPCRRRSRCRSS